MDWKKLLNKLLFPSVWLMILLAVVSTAALIAVFVYDLDTAPIAYAVYVLAFYSLTVITISCTVNFPQHYKSIKAKIYSNQYANRYMTDTAFKTHVSLYRSLTINLLYVAINLYSGFRFHTIWFIILAVYYIILSVMRFLLLRYVRHNAIGEKLIGELKRSRLCAIILLLVNLSLAGAVLMMMYQDRGFDYPGILIYIMAMYTFYITIAAVKNIIKYRKYNSPVMFTAKVINLAAALVSMLSLETAMLTQFGTENSELFRRTMIAATGAGISVILVTMSLYIITRTTNTLRRYINGK